MTPSDKVQCILRTFGYSCLSITRESPDLYRMECPARSIRGPNRRSVEEAIEAFHDQLVSEAQAKIRELDIYLANLGAGQQASTEQEKK